LKVVYNVACRLLEEHTSDSFALSVNIATAAILFERTLALCRARFGLGHPATNGSALNLLNCLDQQTEIDPTSPSAALARKIRAEHTL
jgi:hypothetical protein